MKSCSQFWVSERFYRIRINPRAPSSPAEFDSPPPEFCGVGRLDSQDFPVLYGSQDIQVCLHECRTTVDDRPFVATLQPTRDLKLLDLTHILREGSSASEFESLDIAVHMLFLAGKYAYPISREIARAAKEKGFDGIIYPSYYSLLRTGSRPFETIYGMSIRKIPDLEAYATSQSIANLALVGRPLAQGVVTVKALNAVVLRRAEYSLSFGPVGFENTWASE
jgi:RES domain